MESAAPAQKQPTLNQVIARQIEQSAVGRIPFAEFMALALYHPDEGYYTANRPGHLAEPTVRSSARGFAAGSAVIGPQGDFVTSSYMGCDFGELLAEQFAEMWAVLGQPNPYTLVEMGAGQGLIATDVLAHLHRHHPACFECLAYTIVEKSPALKIQQRQRLERWQTAGVTIRWQSLPELAADSVVGCFFSNELVDALPVHWVEVRDRKLQEIWIASGLEGFQTVLAEPSTPELARYFAKLGIDMPGHYPEGYRTEVNLAAIAWLSEVAAKLARGYILTIDYGYPAERYYAPTRREGTLQCYWRHRYHSDPLIHVGQQDITAHVNFTALERHGTDIGLSHLGFTQQGLFLMALGLGDRLAALSQPTLNTLATARDIQAILGRRETLQQLINPMGLGNFGVLVQAKGLSETEMASPLKGLTTPLMQPLRAGEK